MKKQLFILLLSLASAAPYLPLLAAKPQPIPLEKSQTTITPPDAPQSEQPTATPLESIHPNQLPELTNPIAELSDDEAITYLSPLLSAHSEDNIVDTLIDLPIERAHAIVKKIIETDFPRDLTIQVILGVATHYTNNPKAQRQLFALLETKKLIHGAPPLFIAAQSSYPQIIPSLLAWTGNKKEQMINQTLRYAVAQNSAKELKILKTLITPEQATELLWNAINFNRKASVLQILVDRNANIEQTQQGKTLLIRAVEHLNAPAITVLITAADARKINRKKYINKFVDPAVGTPLQLALSMQIDKKLEPKIKQEAAQIELLLRKYGATENYTSPLK